MHPRWRSDLHGAPAVPDSQEDRSPAGAERGFINQPLPDLEQQLVAELEGASWAVVAFAPEDAAWCDWIYRNLNGYARRGYRSLRQVRDSLLGAFADTDVAELDRLGACARTVEVVSTPEPSPMEEVPAMSTALASAPPQAAGLQRGSKYTICTAVILILFAVIFGTRSFLEITAEEPASTLNVSPVTGVLAGHSAKTAQMDETPSTTPEVVTEPPVEMPTPAVAITTPSSVEPAAAEKAPAPAALPNVAQVAPPAAWATSRILPVDAQAAPRSSPGTASAPPASASNNAAANSASSTETDAVLLDEVRTLERRGDETMAEKRTEDALDLYGTALKSAQEYATRKGANPAARDQVVALMRKVGTLELQNSSTAEARASYIQARKALLQIKSQGQWTHERAKALDEIESRLLSLPRD
jgi:hypothetical protein